MTTINKLANELAAIDALIATIEASDPVLGCWEARRAEVADKLAAEEKAEADKKEALVAEALAQYSNPTRYGTFKLGQVVMLMGKYLARIVDIARNGVWIVRSATEGEWTRTGLDQVRERVSIKQLALA